MFRFISKAALIVIIIFLTFSNARSQVDSFVVKAGAQMRQLEEESMARTSDENKLEGALYHLLKIAEQADTSQEKLALLHNMIDINKSYEADQAGRIKVTVFLNTGSSSSGVVQMVNSLGGVIVSIGYYPYVECKILPKQLRNLISLSSVWRIEELQHGETQNIYVSDGRTRSTVLEDSLRSKHIADSLEYRRELQLVRNQKKAFTKEDLRNALLHSKPKPKQTKPSKDRKIENDDSSHTELKKPF